MSKQQKALERLEKQALVEKQRILKPGECSKYLTAVLDPACITSEVFGLLIRSELEAAGFKVSVEGQKQPGVITWRRKLPQTLTQTEKATLEPHLLRLVSGAVFVSWIKGGHLAEEIQDLREKYPSCTVHLLICGLKTYCRTHRGCIRRTQTEFALTEVQLLQNCSHRLVESVEEVSQAVSQYTKSIAEEPFKRQKTEKLEKETFYLGNDSKDGVKVQNSIGLSRLWQQQLTRLPLVTLEVAEAITAAYPMPALLMRALENSDSPHTLLENLPIRRSGTGATSRRIGPELSRKVSNLFLSPDPNAQI